VRVAQKNARKRIVSSFSVFLQLFETLHPLGEMAFDDTPLAADLESGQFFSLDHSHHGSPGESQQFSGLL